MKQVGWALQIVSHSRRSSMSVQVPFMVHPGKQLQERELHWHKNPTRAVTWQVAAKLQSLCFKESAQQTNMRQRRRHHQLHTDNVPQPSQLFPLADGCCMLPQRISLAGRSSMSPACCNSMVTAQSSAAGALDRIPHCNPPLQKPGHVRDHSHRTQQMRYWWTFAWFSEAGVYLH